MNLADLITQIKEHPDYSKAGMMLCHNGVVRETSRNGKKVSGLRVAVDNEKLKQIIENAKKETGIIEILVEIAEDRNLSVGEDVMLLVVAGDIREHVIATLENTLNRIKIIVTTKTEYFI